MSTQPFGPLGTDQAQALVDFTRQVAGAAGNIDVICFGIGSTLFFYLFLKSAYIPRILSALGIFASVVWTIMYFGKLVFPGHISTMQNVCYALMAIAEVTTGFWLMLFVVKTQGRRDRPSSRPAVSGVLDDGVGGK